MKCERLRMVRFAGAVALAASAALAAACGGSNDAATVTAPTGTVVTETFNGVVPVGGSSVNNFTVTVPGTLSVTLLSTSPQTTLTMGLGIGNPGAGGTCAFLSGGTTQTFAGTTAQLSGTLPASGAYCVAVIDVGNAAGPISYTVTVAHT
jgi:hypothetical protein